jgi:colicin import membrane protein
MATAAFKDDALLPRSRDGLPQGAALALAVHVGLVFALTAAVQWRSHSPEVVAAELWASVPEAAAPPAPVAVPTPPPPPAPLPRTAPPPEPPPPKVDISVERERAAREKAEAERQRQEAEDKRRREQAERAAKAAQQRAREAAEQQARIEAAREDTLRRLMSQAGSVGASGATPGTAARDAAPSASYTARLASLIRGNTVFSGEVAGNPAAEVEVRAAGSGTIISRRLIKSSGHAAWDEAVLRGIDKTGALPRDTDGRVPATVIISFRPKDQ